MMKGIDVSNWQGLINIYDMDIDFVICKATEGTNFVDSTCDYVIEQAKALGKKWGFYHFASNGGALEEAEFFVNNCKNYFGHGIPILDYENSNSIEWCETWLEKVHDMTGVWPIIYMSASRCGEFAGSWIHEKCGLWVAGYPMGYTAWPDSKIPYNISPWTFAAIWQFTSSLQLPQYSGNLDGDYAYMSENGWDSYANSDGSISNTVQKEASSQTVREVYEGKYGDGDTRKHNLENAGYDYDEVQEMVNDYIDKANECIRGVWGNGWNRQNALESMGYDYDVVQLIVNAII